LGDVSILFRLQKIRLCDRRFFYPSLFKDS
jgi:hypothetical protein